MSNITGSLLKILAIKPIKILDIRIPKIMDIKDNPILGQMPCWAHYWLSDYYVCQSGKVHYCYAYRNYGPSISIATNVKAIRPVMELEYTEGITYSEDTKKEFHSFLPGDLILSNGYLFRIINLDRYNRKMLIISETPIGYTCYNKHKPDINKDIYQTSTLNKVFQTWKQDWKISEPNSFGLIKETKAALDVCEIGVPSVLTIQQIPAFELQFSHPFWLKTRLNEFEGASVDMFANITRKPLSSEMDIHPYIRLRDEKFFDKHLDQGGYLLIKGYLFRIISANEAICRNSIGYSCFSNGIEEMKDQDKEKEFYHHSELHETFMYWYNIL